MNDFRFAEPTWIHGVWVIAAVLAILIIFELRRSTALTRLLSAQMQQRLVAIAPLSRRIVSHCLLCCALIALVVALMRPQWGGVVQQLTAARSQIMICLDVSKSMLAEDVVPSRLERAKAEISSLLALLDDSQQVGLIAFAGKATVLSPMTTDFGFLNLILKDAGPQSVGIGGTKIGDAIRTGTDGFRSAGDINRLLLVITDGEDHDSFPVDAAAYAREKGVRIVSIGFGETAGSRIEITDPRTGEKQFLTDRNGEPVISRLDDETLREIALQTQGAYIPAGGGQLDLQSIYDSHIASMLKGTTTEQQRVIRNEGYQWCLLAALVLWAASLVLQINNRIAPALATIATLVLCLCTNSRGIQAQTPSTNLDQSPSASAAEPDQVEQGSQPPVGNAQDDAPVLNPREVYNLALGSMTGALSGKEALEQAEEQLTDARNRAGVDGELRFRSVYNLGWLAADKASQEESKQPEEALKHLQLALGRFREAVRLRPDNEQARFNLEVISKRILVLKDKLSQQDAGTLEQQLDALLESLRDHQTKLKTVLATHDDQLAPSKSVRAAFRSLGVTQRQIISDFYEFTQRARTELQQAQASQSKAQAGQQPGTSPPPPTSPSVDPALRSAQITAMLGHIDLAMNWLQKARSFTRRIVPSSAFLRWSAAIRETRQARDQLRNPIEVLSVLLADTVQLNDLTLRIAEGTAQKQVWLTLDYLEEEQAADANRTGELLSLLQSALGQAQPNQAVDPAATETPEEVLEQIQAAIPWIEKAAEYLNSSSAKLAAENPRDAVSLQLDAVEAFRLASEQFFDLRRLIEAAYAQQVQIREALPDGDSIVDSQAMNLERAERIEKMLQRQLEQLQTNSPPQDPSQPAPDQDQQKAEIARLEIGQQLLTDAREAMQQIQTLLTSPKDTNASAENAKTEIDEDGNSQNEDTDSNSTTDTDPTADDTSEEEGDLVEASPTAEPPSPSDTAVEKLAELRRLFFTLVEHLKDTASRQAELNQDTTSSMSDTALDEGSEPGELGPLAERQNSLQAITQTLATAFAEQAQAASETEQTPTEPDGDESVQPGSSDKLKAAADLIEEASKEQILAARLLDPQSSDADAPQDAGAAPEDETSQEDSTAATDDGAPTPQTAQLAALKHLVEAIQLLDDQQQNQQDQQNQDGDDQQNQDSGQQETPQQDQSQQNGAPEQTGQQQTASAEQLLQLIREQEAQRRRDKQNAQAVSGTTDKDW
ncbi:MAG: hypothetical protein Aurels2KO_43950 [Aureliella sp.]